MRILCAFCKGLDHNSNETLRRVIYKDKQTNKMTEGLACSACLDWLLNHDYAIKKVAGE